MLKHYFFEEPSARDLSDEINKFLEDGEGLEYDLVKVSFYRNRDNWFCASIFLKYY